jgi:TRAP-type C4-dicarboxylate transport system substrate-binding protein
VDGQENPYGVIKSNKFEEVQKYLTKTGHVYNASPFLISKVFWDKLTDKEQEIMKKAAQEAKVYQRQLNEQEDKDAEAQIVARGVVISDLNPGEKDKAKQILQPLYKEVAARTGGDLIDRLLAAVK